MKPVRHGFFKRFVFLMIIAVLSTTAGQAMAADGEPGTTVYGEDGQSVMGESSNGVNGEDGESVVAESGTAAHGEDRESVVGESRSSADSTDAFTGDDLGSLTDYPSGNIEFAPSDLSLDTLIQYLIEVLYQALSSTIPAGVWD